MTTRAREAAEGWKGVQVGGGRCGLRTDTKTTRQLAAAADAMLPTKKLCSKLNEEVVGETERKSRGSGKWEGERGGGEVAAAVFKSNYKFLS